MSQGQLAAAAGISQAYLSQIENDEVQNLSTSTLLRLAGALQIDPYALLREASDNQGPDNGNGQRLEAPLCPGGHRPFGLFV